MQEIECKKHSSNREKRLETVYLVYQNEQVVMSGLLKKRGRSWAWHGERNAESKNLSAVTPWLMARRCLVKKNFPKIQASFACCLWARFFMFVLELSNFPEINGFLAAILAKICFRHSQADLGLEAAWFRVLHTFRSTNSTTASWNLKVVGAPIIYEYGETFLKLHLVADVWKTRDKHSRLSPNGLKI